MTEFISRLCAVLNGIQHFSLFHFPWCRGYLSIKAYSQISRLILTHIVPELKQREYCDDFDSSLSYITYNKLKVITYHKAYL